MSAILGFPSSSIAPVQPNPPGGPGTTQSPWSQTSTGGAQANTLTQPSVPGKTNYCTGIQVTGNGATGQSNITITLSSGGTVIANFTLDVLAGANTALPNLIVNFNPPISGLGPGQNMVLTVPSFGAGNTNASANMQGYSV